MSLTGDRDALDDLAHHWFMGFRLVTRESSEATFLVEDKTLGSYVSHILLPPFGRSVRIREPDSLKQRMIELVSQLAAFYRDVS